MGEIKSYNSCVKRLTNGPKHHLFGFHDLEISNYKCNKFLSLEVDIINRPPMPGELYGVGYVTDGEFVKLGETTAMNYPQGSRQQWVGDTELFTTNNQVGDIWGTDLYDTESNKLIDRFPASTHMLSKDGRFSYGLDYARLFRLGMYGYVGIKDRGANELVPEDSGITVMDLKTKEVRLLVSVRQAAECGHQKCPMVTPHYLTHLLVNPSSTRIAFLHRYTVPGGGLIERLMTVGTDGTDLRCLAQGFMSHFDWKDDKHLYIFGRANSSIDSIQNSKLLSNPVMASPIMIYPLKIARKLVKSIMHGGKGGHFGKTFLMISDEPEPKIVPFGQNTIPVDGHPMTNPSNRDWCICDNYPDDNMERDLFLYQFSKDLRINLCRFKEPKLPLDMSQVDTCFADIEKDVIKTISLEKLTFARTGLHCDFHPRWSHDGRLAFFDSLHEGTRQIYYINVSNLLSA